MRVHENSARTVRYVPFSASAAFTVMTRLSTRSFPAFLALALCSSALGATTPAQPAPAQQARPAGQADGATGPTGPLNYETQVLAIFRAAAGHGGPIQVGLAQGPANPVQKKALQRIYDKLLRHEMFLKNIVWRPDLKVIRVTWADAQNHNVFKVVYRVNHDPVLTNSVYADKNQILDVKIMYLDGGHYRYLHLNHGAPARVLSNGVIEYFASPKDPRASPTPVVGPYGYYSMQTHVSPQQCKFCHMLVRGVGGKPGGIFFPRYQEAKSSLDADETDASGFRHPSFFQASDFHPIDPAKAPVALPAGLPNPVLFNRVGFADPATRKLYTMYVRTMFEAPQLVEAMARDNHESLCISADFSSAAPLFGKDNYVCADGVRKRLFVKFRNPLLSTGSGEVSYSKPYYAEQ